MALYNPVMTKNISSQNQNPEENSEFGLGELQIIMGVALDEVFLGGQDSKERLMQKVHELAVADYNSR